MMSEVSFLRKTKIPRKKPRKLRSQKKLRKLLVKALLLRLKNLTTASIDDILGFGTGLTAVPTKPMRDPQKVPKEWQAYYDDLMELRIP